MSIESILRSASATTLGSATPSMWTIQTAVPLSRPTFLTFSLSLGVRSRRRIIVMLVFMSSTKPSRGPRSTLLTGGSAIARTEYLRSENTYADGAPSTISTMSPPATVSAISSSPISSIGVVGRVF